MSLKVARSSLVRTTTVATQMRQTIYRSVSALSLTKIRWLAPPACADRKYRSAPTEATHAKSASTRSVPSVGHETKCVA